MDVRLINHTPDPERAIAVAARLCYAPVGAAELLETADDASLARVLKTILDSGHHSTLEHASFTFAIDGVSRALTHQLVRHRMASYNQQSQRYVRFDGDPVYIVPPTVVEAGDDVLRRYAQAVEAAWDAYGALVEAGIPAEDARYLLPNAAETKIAVTMNARELLHFFELRCCKRAQWEIRELALAMLVLVQEVAPTVFHSAGASCRRGPCREGRMTCGEPYPRVAHER